MDRKYFIYWRQISMSTQKTKAEIQTHKDNVIADLSSFLDKLIETPTDAKRADLISYWLKDFQRYISQEKDFDASKIKSYKRGDVIKVNLGFNIGSEQGGLRYAIVLDKNNKHNSKTITVIPLTSQKEEKKIYERDVDLGRELYSRLKAKYDSALDELQKERQLHVTALDNARQLLDSLSKAYTDEDEETMKAIEHAIKQAEELFNSQNDVLNILSDEERSLDKIKSELYKMKDGSIAKIEQITTISKQRIFDPKGSKDVLSGIQFSSAAMDKINEKLKELYIF